MALQHFFYRFFYASCEIGQPTSNQKEREVKKKKFLKENVS
jgi:hypothetical protein